MNVRAVLVIAGIAALFITSCKNSPEPQHNRQKVAQAVPRKDYLELILSLDTLSFDGYRKAIYREDSLLSGTVDSANVPFHHFFRGKKYLQAKQRDSAMAEFRQMKGLKTNDDIELLKTYSLLTQAIPTGAIVEAELMNQILAAMKVAEKQNSRITHWFYDLMAKAYYQNQNANESLDYAERYYDNHPYKRHPVIMQRHYDISFLLASRMNDYDKMMFYNVQARNLALRINDSLAIARTYDNEAQVFSRRGENDKALASSKKYFDFLKRTNNLNAIAYNNLATSYVRNNQPDSAIYYYRAAIRFVQNDPTGKQSPIYYKGLINAYKIKGDYKAALQIADSAYAIEVNNIKEVEAVKFAEIHEKYETEKKDKNISILQGQNVFNEKIIRQQKWMLILAILVFLGILLFFYFMHRQYRLQEKNKLLESENQRLNMEQKLLQVQLNPHFIFNAIANLQSLVASGDTSKSVRYLSAFSGLLRNVLEHSRRDLIGLNEEITYLENYLQLNQMRFAGLFDYEINVDDNIYPADYLVPPMLIQPFVENAIEHGFRNINYKGNLSISFNIKNQQMFITVEDNGVGLISKEPGEQKKQSLAGIILKERLEVLFKTKGQDAKYEIEDKKRRGGQGVLVNIVIPEIKD
jgi:tetratricopeptide (TPR) repeat protein